MESSVLPFALENRIGVIVYSPMASGLLTGKFSAERVAALPADDFRSHVPHFREPQLSENLAAAERLRELGERHGASAGATAVAWTLRNPVVTGAIVGFRNAAQVDGILPAAGELVLSAEEIDIAEG